MQNIKPKAMTLPQSTIDRIHEEAMGLRKAEIDWRFDDAINDVAALSYIQGAEHEAKRAQELVEVLKMCYKSLCTYGEHPIIDKAVEQALKNYGE